MATAAQSRTPMHLWIIGGIAAAQFGEVLATGVGSIAVVRALVAAPQPEAEAARLMRLMDGSANPR